MGWKPFWKLTLTLFLPGLGHFFNVIVNHMAEHMGNEVKLEILLFAIENCNLPCHCHSRQNLPIMTSWWTESLRNPWINSINGLQRHLYCWPWIMDEPTGSTIRNWDKVKTWLDQIFWQIYQNWCPVASWVVEVYSWSTILTFFFTSCSLNSLWQKGAKIQHEFSWFCQKKVFFQNIKIKWY